jgi:hypothetical protein
MLKPLKDYEIFYNVSSNGQIISKRFNKPLKPFLCKKGYYYVDLFDGESKKRRSVHSLVAEHFVDGYKEGNHVNHMDKNRKNNDYENLEWVTPRENILHSHAVRVAKLDKITEEVLKVYDAIISAQEEDGFKTPEIVKCCKGRAKSHYGFKWKYVD